MVTYMRNSIIFRHRPEVQKPAEDNTIKEASGSAHSTKFKSGETCCAVVMVRTERLDELKMSYNKAFWVTREGETLTSRCYLRKVVIANGKFKNTNILLILLYPIIFRNALYHPAYA